MRRSHNILLGLIMLTALDGKPVWVESTQVIVVRRSLDCAHGTATTILVGSKALCVKETVDEVRAKVKAANE